MMSCRSVSGEKREGRMGRLITFLSFLVVFASGAPRTLSLCLPFSVFLKGGVIQCPMTYLQIGKRERKKQGEGGAFNLPWAAILDTFFFTLHPLFFALLFRWWANSIALL